MRRHPKPLTRWKKLRHRLELAGVIGLAVILQLGPRQLARWFGERVGWLMFHLLGHERRIALANLRLAFGESRPPAELHRLARASFANAHGSLVAMAWSPRFRKVDIRPFVENPEEYDRAKALQTERGLIMLTLHFGDWEMLGLATAAYGLKTTVVARELPNAALSQRITELRGLTGHTIIPQAGAVKRLLHGLRRGEAVGLLADLNGRREGGGVWLNFFGLPVFNNSSVAALALRTGAPICLLVAEPRPGGRVRILSSGPIQYTPTGDYGHDVQELSQCCLSAGEAMIREHPEYWLWNYRRWRHRPTPEQGRYPFYSSHNKRLPPFVSQQK